MGFKWLEKDLFRALKAAGNQDKYQNIVVCLLCLIFFLNIFLIIGSSIYLMDPVFVCQGSDISVDQKSACPRIASCKVGKCVVRIVNNFTIVSKMRLYCDDQYKRSILQSSLSIGSLFGLIVMNFVSDIKGRKFALIADLGIAVLSTAITYVGASFQSIILLTLGQMLSGFSGYSLIIISYIILGDICEESMRQKSSIFINCFLSLGLCTFYFIYNWFNEWEVILILFMLIPLFATTVLCYIVLQQSPNFLLFSLKNPQECLKSLINIAKMNSKTYEDVQMINFYVNRIRNKMQNRKKQYGKQIQRDPIKSLVKWKYLKIIVLMSIVESAGNLCFYGVGYAINDIGYSFGFMNLLLGITQIVTTLAVGKYVTTLSRKKTLGLVYGLTPILTFFFMIKPISNSSFLCTILILLMRVMTSKLFAILASGYLMIVMIQTESFPLEIQSIGAGAIEGFSQIGSFIAPLLNAFSINNQIPRVLTIGFAMIVFIIPLAFVPETSSKVESIQRKDNRSVKSQILSFQKI